jgi:hypothetical protein
VIWFNWNLRETYVICKADLRASKSRNSRCSGGEVLNFILLNQVCHMKIIGIFASLKDSEVLGLGN